MMNIEADRILENGTSYKFKYRTLSFHHVNGVLMFTDADTSEFVYISIHKMDCIKISNDITHEKGDCNV